MLTRLAPFLFVLLWSSSFVAAKTGLRDMSPLLFVAILLAGCAAVLVVLMLLLRRSWRPLAGWRWLHCAIAGALLNAVGLMAPHVGMLVAPAAQIALVQSLTPLLAAASGVAPAVAPASGVPTTAGGRTAASRAGRARSSAWYQALAGCFLS